METFDFCPGALVPVTVPPESGSVKSMNGWEFSSRPNVPYRRIFKVKLYGLRWYLDENDLYDSTTDPTINARALELFYATHQKWKEFNWTHPHIGSLVCRFNEPVEVPAGLPNSGGNIEELEITLIEHNPGF